MLKLIIQGRKQIVETAVLVLQGESGAPQAPLSYFVVNNGRSLQPTLCCACMLAAGGWYSAFGVSGFPEGCAYGIGNDTVVATDGYSCLCVKGVSVYDKTDTMSSKLWRRNAGKVCTCPKECRCRVKHTFSTEEGWGIDMMLVGYAKKVSSSNKRQQTIPAVGHTAL